MKLVDTPFFVYRGGKSRLRRFIIRWLPLNGSTYFEPFAGRGNLFFLMKAINGYNKYILNDTQTIPFFESLKKYRNELLPILKTKEEVLTLKKTNIDLYNIMEPILLWGGGINNAGITGYRNHNLVNYKNNILNAKKLLYETNLYDYDAIELLDSLSLDKDSLVYLDPPYLNGNVGIYKSNSFDRKKMIELLQNAKYKWALSEYECNDLNEAFGKPLIKYYNVAIKTPSSNVAKRATEVLYTNYSIENGPNRLNFGDSEHPLSISRNIFQKCNTMTENYFMEHSPIEWSKRTKIAQFKRLTCIPEAYFDGITLYNLDLIKSWPTIL